MQGKFGNKDLIIGEIESLNGLATPEPDAFHRENYKNIKDLEMKFMQTSNTAHSPISIASCSHHSIDTLPLSKEGPSIPQNSMIAQKMNQTVKEGMK